VLPPHPTTPASNKLATTYNEDFIILLLLVLQF
jgi:hypothetical protein